MFSYFGGGEKTAEEQTPQQQPPADSEQLPESLQQIDAAEKARLI